MLGVRSCGHLKETKNLQFFGELGVKGTPLKSYKFKVFDSAEAAILGVLGRGCGKRDQEPRGRWLRGVENPKFVRI